MAKFSEEERLKWKERIEPYEASGKKISITRWCHEKQIHYDSFLYWKEKFTKPPISKTDFLAPWQLYKMP